MRIKGVTITKDELPGLVNRVKALTRQEVVVGVPSQTAGRSDGITNAALAYIHENGAPEAGIPSRPFLSTAIQDNAAPLAVALSRVAANALDGDATRVTAGLNNVALRAESMVKAKINEGHFEDLAASTLRSRRARGRTGVKPLIDTGQLRNSIRGVVRTKD